MTLRARAPLALCLALTAACGTDPAGDTGAADSSSSSGATTEDPTGEPDPTGSSTGEPSLIPEFGGTFTVIGTVEDGLDVVRDLEFNPAFPEQLWTYNMLSHGTVIFFEPGTEDQTSEVRIDRYGEHFMAFVSSAAFTDDNRFATCQESRDEWNGGPQQPDDFMGPSLWPADLAIFAKVGQEFPAGAQEGSHLDMLHQSPLCMGIAHDTANVFWAFDGDSGDIVRYDFQADHGPGGGDHSDGVITRYIDATVTRLPNIPGHMELDHTTGLLYIADPGGGRIMRLDTKSGTDTGPLSGEWDGAVYTGVEGADYQLLVDGLDEPSGLALHDGRLFIAEHGTGDLIAYDLEGAELQRLATPAKRIMGITFGPAGDLWYADAGANQVVRIDP